MLIPGGVFLSIPEVGHPRIPTALEVKREDRCHQGLSTRNKEVASQLRRNLGPAQKKGEWPDEPGFLRKNGACLKKFAP